MGAPAERVGLAGWRSGGQGAAEAHGYSDDHGRSGARAGAVATDAGRALTYSAGAEAVTSDVGRTAPYLTRLAVVRTYSSFARSQTTFISSSSAAGTRSTGVTQSRHGWRRPFLSTSIGRRIRSR